jgi:hypothetical protein
LGFVGSIAYYYSRFLYDVASEFGATVGKIIKSPMEGLMTVNSYRLMANGSLFTFHYFGSLVETMHF